MRFGDYANLLLFIGILAWFEEVSEGVPKEEQGMSAKERKSRAINEEELNKNQEKKRIEALDRCTKESGPS